MSKLSLINILQISFVRIHVLTTLTFRYQLPQDSFFPVIFIKQRAL